MFVTIISDCNDPNESARQLTRANVLFNCPANSLKLGNYSDIEASGNLIDVLDAADGKEGVVIVNVAPRFGTAKRWANGVPFGFFYHKDTLVVSVASREALFLVKKLNIADKMYLTEIPLIVDLLVSNQLLESSRREYVKNTQFRSFEYAPKLAKLVMGGVELPKTEVLLEDHGFQKGVVWFVDSFGNCKTSLLQEDLIIDADGFVQTKWGKIKYYDRLKDIENDELGIYVGSSGIADKRFIEISIQGGNASSGLGIKIGDEVLAD